MMNIDRQKLLILLLCIFSITFTYTQLPAGVGLNKDPYLNRTEAKLLNENIDANGEFNFRNKRIRFLFVSDGSFYKNLSSSKTLYFKMLANKKKIYSDLIILTSNEKKRLKHYDGLILFSDYKLYQKDRLRIKSIEFLVKQENNNPKYLQNMGLDNNEFLNSYEKDYFNSKFETDFNFDNKLIGYVDISKSGKKYISKMEYFSKIKISSYYYSKNKERLITESSEGINLGIYDAIIVTDHTFTHSAQKSNPANVLSLLLSYSAPLLIFAIPILLGSLLLRFLAKRKAIFIKFISSILVVLISSALTYLVIWLLGISEIYHNGYGKNFIISAYMMIFFVQSFILTATEIIAWKTSFWDSLPIALVYSFISSFPIYLAAMFASVGDMMLS